MKLGIVLGLVAWCSCAADVSTRPRLSTEAEAPAQNEPAHPIEDSIRPPLPAEVTINEDAGLGGLLLVTLRSESGEALLFVVDTGSPAILLDKSLEPGLGRCLGATTIQTLVGRRKGRIYTAPKFYLGATPLMAGSNIVAVDLKKMLSPAGRPIVGILGMDCLRHYCITVGKAPGDSPNWIGLRFLARHLVTFDFPRGIMYLNRTESRSAG